MDSPFERNYSTKYFLPNVSCVCYIFADVYVSSALTGYVVDTVHSIKHNICYPFLQRPQLFICSILIGRTLARRLLAIGQTIGYFTP